MTIYRADGMRRSTVTEESLHHPVKIVYTNYRHETAVRTIIPERVWFGSTEWHPEPQWLLEALDVERGEQRSFAMADIRCWLRDPVADGEKP